ncbi:hypothetical protein HHI36_018269 [Cryptolaemus montrouzieri]|uniref:Knr4/Smi1-like domain-containing protein n=1 Tax=Cryptolaemus montrouzieri TaxID=559131 RepID=A0ABD2NZI5_9CUCU
MGFCVDKVSEDSFYENLLIGLPKILDKLPNIHDRKLKRNSPATKFEVRNWEKLNGLSLPQDLQDFYLSCNGLLYTYTFYYEPTNRDDLKYHKMFAKMEVNPINTLTQVEGYEIKNFARIFHDGYVYKMELSAKSKVFELSNNDNFKVVLVYTECETTPTIWIWDDKTFYFIANNITTYLKMAIAHIGVPYWQFIFTPMGLPGRTREMLNVIAPGILYEDRALVIEEDDNKYVNKLDPNLFNKVAKNYEIKKPLVKKNSVSTIDNKSSGGTIARKSSGVTVGRKASSVASTNSERIKRRAFSKRRPFTPKF